MMARKRKRPNWTPQPRPRRRTELRAAPARGAIAGCLVISLICFGIFFAVRGDCRSLGNDLRGHGTPTVASVTQAGTNKYGELVDVDVRFEAGSRPATARLCVPSGGSLPRGITRGSALAVMYDPEKPSDAMLESQVEHPHGWSLTMVAGLAGGVLFLGLSVATLIVRRRRRTP